MVPESGTTMRVPVVPTVPIPGSMVASVAFEDVHESVASVVVAVLVETSVDVAVVDVAVLVVVFNVAAMEQVGGGCEVSLPLPLPLPLC